MRMRKWIGLAAVICLGPSAMSGAGGPERAKDLPTGLAPHLEKVSGGYINWTTGVIVAEGRGRATGTSKKDRLMAERAAAVAAARNALLLANNILVGSDGRMSDVEEGDVRLRGVLKGHKTTSITWTENVSPVECVAEVTAPIWGAKGVASVVSGRPSSKAGGGENRLRLTRDKAKASGAVLIIDARGTGLRPCLFPTILDAKQRVLYDHETRRSSRRLKSPPVRYAETTLSYEHSKGPKPKADAGAGFAPLACLANEPPATPPTTQSAGPALRRLVVKATGAAGENKTDIVLTAEDAEALANNADGAALLRNGKVIVLVDAAGG